MLFWIGNFDEVNAALRAIKFIAQQVHILVEEQFLLTSLLFFYLILPLFVFAQEASFAVLTMLLLLFDHYKLDLFS